MFPILTSLCLVAAPQTVTPVGSLQRLVVPVKPSGTIVVNVELDGIPSELVMTKHSVRAAGFRVLEAGPDGSLIDVPATVSKTWRGTITGRPGARVIASITDEGLSAVVVDEALEMEWQVQPAEGKTQGLYSVAKMADLLDSEGLGGIGSSMGPAAQSTFADQNTSARVSALGTGLQLCEIALDADYEFFLRNGSSVAGTVDDMERIMNRVDDIFARDCDVTFQITGVVVRSSPNDPYTSNAPTDLLQQFQGEWTNNLQDIHRDVAHLFTGRDLSNGIIGLSFTGAVCDNSTSYGLSESRFSNNILMRTAITAHQLGINFNQGNCHGGPDCRLMCFTIGGCTGDVTQFGLAAATGIRDYAISLPCLLDLASPLALPVTDDVPTVMVNTDIWISNQGTEASTDAVGEPSGTRSLQFNAPDAGTYNDDTIITNRLLLAGLSDTDISFALQARGVQSGNAIRVDLLNSSGNWEQVVRVASNGVTEDSFTTIVADLPTSGYYDGAQLRIVAEVDGPTETWYVDDFSIINTNCGSVTSICLGSPTSASTGATLSVVGSTGLAENNFSFLASDLPPQQFGLLIYGSGQAFSPLGDGFLCVAGTPTLYRLTLAQADSFGMASIAVDFNNLAAGSSIAAFDSVNWQFWFRDTTPSGFNLTEAVSVTFCP